MKERPIIFQPWKAKFIIEHPDMEIQTRRVIKEQELLHRVWEEHDDRPMYCQSNYWMLDGGRGEEPEIRCPYGQVGDRLWLKETFAYESPDGDRYVTVIPNETKILYHATDDWEGVRVPSIFMPRWASRITLEITDIRVERLQEITYGDVKAEGIVTANDGSLRGAIDMAEEAFNQFKQLWNSLNAKYPWESNPWVWVISFRR